MAAVAQKLKPQESELLSISEIAKRCKLDRATVRSRLDDLGYDPDESSTAKNKLYPFNDAMEFEIKAAKDAVSAMKIRDLRATAQIKEMKLAEAKGELVPMHEAIEDLHAILAWIYQELTVRQPKRIVAKLAKAKNATAVRKALKTDTDNIWKNLRINFEKFLD